MLNLQHGLEMPNPQPSQQPRERASLPLYITTENGTHPGKTMDLNKADLFSSNVNF